MDNACWYPVVNAYHTNRNNRVTGVVVNTKAEHNPRSVGGEMEKNGGRWSS